MKFCFDCDDTLYNCRQPFLDALAAMIPDYNGDMDAFYRCYRDNGEKVFEYEQKNIITNDDVGIYRIYMACKECGIPFGLLEAADFQDLYRQNQKHIHMAPALHTFFQNTNSEISILSNGQEAHQKDKIRTLGMYNYVKEDHVFISEQIGVNKPHKEAFEIMAHSLHTQPEDWIYIGDHYINDIQGAKQAGMHTIHMNRHHHQEGPCADVVVYTEEELVNVLKKLENEHKQLKQG
jgi:putative hydrolase of the HAD superfamily